MDDDAVANFRRRRMMELVDAIFGGNNAAFGRKLGYKDGAYVGQMLRGERAITEKRVREIEALPRCAGWFSPVNSPAPPPKPKFAARELRESQWATLQDIEVLPHEERDALLREIHERAERFRAVMREVLARHSAATDADK